MGIITTEQIITASDYLKARVCNTQPKIALVLGSGLNDLAQSLSRTTTIPFDDVPGMNTPLLSGHKGNFIFGWFENHFIVCMQGRIHGYEGYSAQEIAFPIFVLAQLGVKTLFITNAAGGINPSYNIGDVMMITNHINLLGQNPCAGSDLQELFGPAFFDMTHAYSPTLQNIALSCAQEHNISLHQGVYIATLGPSFETPAEIKAFSYLGADAVGMSTVYEVIAANYCGMEVLGLSLISNPAAGVSDVLLSPEDITEAAIHSANSIQLLLASVIKQM